MYELGIVQYSNEERGIGFVDHHLHTEHVMFSAEHYRGINYLEDPVQAINVESIISFTPKKLLEMPKPGKWLIFAIVIGKRGPIASPWSFGDLFYHSQLIEHELEARQNIFNSKQPFFRIKELSPEIKVPTTILMGEERLIRKVAARKKGSNWWIEKKYPETDWHKITMKDLKNK